MIGGVDYTDMRKYNYFANPFVAFDAASPLTGFVVGDTITYSGGISFAIGLAVHEGERLRGAQNWRSARCQRRGSEGLDLARAAIRALSRSRVRHQHLQRSHWEIACTPRVAARTITVASQVSFSVSTESSARKELRPKSESRSPHARAHYEKRASTLQLGHGAGGDDEVERNAAIVASAYRRSQRVGCAA